MFDVVLQYIGWSACALLPIPVVLLVRLLVKRSRWSILRVTVVSLVGVAVAALWLCCLGKMAGEEGAALGGALGEYLLTLLEGWTGSALWSTVIANALFFLWIVAALLDAVTATARFIINKPYIKEIKKVKVVEKVVEKVKWIEKERPVEPKPQPKPKPEPKKDPIKAPVRTPDKPVIPKPAPRDIRSVDEAPAYRLPAPSLLHDGSRGHHTVSRGEIEQNIATIRECLADHRVQVADIQAVPGPTVTLYKVYPAKDVKESAIRNLTNDVSLALKAGKVQSTLLDDCVGMQVANRQRSMVSMRELVESDEFKGSPAELPIAIGREVTGEIKVFDLADAPHLLVAGATGQGKSVGLNVLVASLLYAKRPSELKLVFIDPKKTEFSLYSRLHHHYLAVLPNAQSEEDERAKAIVKDQKSAATVLLSLCEEMAERYRLLESAGVQKITDYNAKYLAHKLNPEKGHHFLPYIVTIIDEYAQLVLGNTGGPEGRADARRIMGALISIASMGRACGLHLVIATQTPRREVISGLIKANFPMSIAYKTKTDVDSRVILDEPGAEKLLGRGDMLISKNADTDRVQCGNITGDEIDAITRSIEAQKGPGKSFHCPYYLPEVKDEEGSGSDMLTDPGSVDDRFEEAARLIVLSQRGSTSDLQRKMSIGYAKAGRIMDQLEAAGIVGPQNGSQKRDVLVGPDELEQILSSLKK